MDKADAELSWAVARVLWPDHKHNWQTVSREGKAIVRYPEDLEFDYRTDDALGKMAMWVAKNGQPPESDRKMGNALGFDNPHLSMVKLVLAIAGGDQ